MTGKEAEAAERLDAARTAARLGCSVGNLTKRQREMLVAKVCCVVVIVDVVVFTARKNAKNPDRLAGLTVWFQQTVNRVDKNKSEGERGGGVSYGDCGAHLGPECFPPRAHEACLQNKRSRLTHFCETPTARFQFSGLTIPVKSRTH